MSASSGAYTTASASSARISSTLFVATTPSGSMPMMSPTSLPALSAECTQQPASSRSGCSITPLMAATPTPPVAHCTTRSPISSPLYTAKLEHVLHQSTAKGVTIAPDDREQDRVRCAGAAADDGG